MSFYRYILRRGLCSLEQGSGAAAMAASKSRHPVGVLYATTRTFAFSSAEEAAAERRRRKRRLRIEPPLYALRRDPNSPRPPPDPNAPRLPDSTSALVGPRLNLHNRVQSLIRAGDLDSASSTARHAVFSRTRPTVFTCNAVVASMYRASRYDDAVALFHFFFEQSNIVPNVVSYNFLIVTHCDAGRVDIAVEVYRHMLAHAPFSPSPVTYRHLTKGLVASSRITEAMDLLREMLHRGHGADSLVYNNLMAGFIELGNMEKALELFDELKERCLVYDGVVHATLMEGYFNRGMEKEAMDSYESLLQRQFKMNAVTCNTLLQVLLNRGKTKEAESLFDHMLSSHNPPSFQAMNSDTYTIMVNESFKKGKPEEAIEVFHRTGTKPCTMDVLCYNNIISKLCERGSIPEAQKLFDEMPAKSMNPDEATYSFLIDAFFKEGKISEALNLFEKMVTGGESAPKINVASFNKVFEELVKVSRVNPALEIFGRMREKGLRPDQASYSILIRGLCSEMGLDQARRLIEEMVGSGVQVGDELRETVLEAFGRGGRMEEVRGLFAEKLVNGQTLA